MIACVQDPTQQTGGDARRTRLADRSVERPKQAGIGLHVAALILLFSAACSRDNSQRAEALALLERIATLDLRASSAERTRRIERLRALPLSDAALVRVRDRCALAHAGLLAAELEQATARQRLDAAEARGAPVARAELEAIAAAVAHASQSLQSARTALPECEQSTLALSARYQMTWGGTRRPSPTK
jgi:hypothetical protein